MCIFQTFAAPYYIFCLLLFLTDYCNCSPASTTISHSMAIITCFLYHRYALRGSCSTLENELGLGQSSGWGLKKWQEKHWSGYLK